MKDIYQYLFLLTKVKSEEDFPFYEKRQKVKIVLSVWFAAADTEAAWIPGMESGSTKLLPSEPLSISALSDQSFDLCMWAPVLYFSSLCASLSRMCPKVIASLLYHLGLWEVS